MDRLHGYDRDAHVYRVTTGINKGPRPGAKGIDFSVPPRVRIAMHGVERYLNIRQAYGASIRADGRRVSFLLDTTGHSEVWTVDAPRQWPEQRTMGDDRVLFCSYAPEGRTLVFGRDEGGNERTQFFRIDPDDGGVHPLTDHHDAKHYWGGWRHDGTEFAFASNRRDESVFDVYTQGLDEHGEEATRELEWDGWISVSGYAPDDTRLLLTEAHSSFDQDLHVLSLEDGEVHHLTPHEDDARYQSASWGPDGEGVYCVSDRNDDTRNLVRIDAENGDLETVVDAGDWGVDGVSIDHDSGRIVYSRNVEGYTKLTAGTLVGPTSIDELPTPALPDGVAGGISWGPTADRIAVTATGRTRNANVYVISLVDGTCERWTAAPTAGIPPATFREPELVRIESFDGLAVPGFLTLPEATTPNGTPVIVDIHGGPESQRRPSFSSLLQYFVANGYAVFEPNVRGSSGYGRAYTRLDDVEKRMDSVADIAACVDWLEDHPMIDPNRIVAKGGSYGGFMVLAAMTEYPERWAAGVDIVGIANFVTFLENTGSWRREHREAEYGSLENDREFLESISPIHRIDRIRAPLFVIHGENDPRVPVGEAEQIADAAAEHVPVETLIFEDEGHGIAKLENQIEAYSRVVEFLDKHV